MNILTKGARIAAQRAPHTTARRRRSFVPLVVCLALLLSACVGASGVQHGGQGEVPLLSVRGNVLSTTHGHRFVIRGVVVYALPFYYGGGGRVDPALEEVTSYAWTHRSQLFQAIRATGANVVRIPVSVTVYSDNRYFAGGGRGYLQRLSGMVAAARAAGLYVIIVWWDSLGYGPHLSQDYRRLFPMMRAVERLFRHDDGVIYEPYNEPHGITWGQWLTVTTNTLVFWRKSLRYRGILILDTTGYSWDISPLYLRTILDAGRFLQSQPDLLFANHRYPNGATCFCGGDRQRWHQEVGSYLSRLPVVGSEYGIYDGHGPASANWGRGFLGNVAKNDIPRGLNGAITFVWDWVDPNSMTNPSTHQLTYWGQVVVTQLLHQHFS